MGATYKSHQNIACQGKCRKHVSEKNNSYFPGIPNSSGGRVVWYWNATITCVNAWKKTCYIITILHHHVLPNSCHFTGSNKNSSEKLNLQPRWFVRVLIFSMVVEPKKLQLDESKLLWGVAQASHVTKTPKQKHHTLLRVGRRDSSTVSFWNAMAQPLDTLVNNTIYRTYLYNAVLQEHTPCTWHRSKRNNLIA